MRAFVFFTTVNRLITIGLMHSSKRDSHKTVNTDNYDDVVSVIIIIGISFHSVVGGFFSKVQWQQASLQLQDFLYDPGCVEQHVGLHGFNPCSDSDLV